MNVNIVLYDEFETLDALGIANIFGMAPEHFYINYYKIPLPVHSVRVAGYGK